MIQQNRHRVQPQKSHELLAEQMIEQIRSGAWSPGQKLPSVVDLSAAYGVGRSTMREAISALKATGWLFVRHGGGTFVSETLPNVATSTEESLFQHADSLKELLEVRKVLESGAAMLAATNHTEEDLKILSNILDRMEASLAEQSSVNGEQADVDFHLAIAAASHNSLLAQLMESLSQRLRETIRDTRTIWFSQEAATAARLYEEHRRIYEAIQSRLPEQAREAIVDHLTKVEAMLQRLKSGASRND